MENIFYFLLGMIFGGFIGSTLILCLQLGKINKYEREIEKLKNLHKKNL